MAQQIAQTAIAFQEQLLGRKPTSVTVVLGGDTLTIAMHGVFSPAEKAPAASPAGATQLQDFHQQLFKLSSEPLRQETRRITGLMIRERGSCRAGFPTPRGSAGASPSPVGRNRQ